MSRNVMIIIGLAVVGAIAACCCCIVFFGGTIAAVFSVTQPIMDAGEKFLIEAKEGDYQTAYTYISPTITEISGAEDLSAYFNQYAPSGIDSWSINSRSLTNGLGRLEGTLTLKDGSSRSIVMEFREENEAWKITYLEIAE